MRLGMRENNNGISGIVDFEMVKIWSMERSYDDALSVFGNSNVKEWRTVLNKIEEVINDARYPECIILYNNNSRVMPKFFDSTDLSCVTADEYGDVTTAKPDVAELFIYEEGKCRKVLDKALIDGYIDFKDFDAVMLTYVNITETKGNTIKKVLIDLSDIK